MKDFEWTRGWPRDCPQNCCWCPVISLRVAEPKVLEYSVLKKKKVNRSVDRANDPLLPQSVIQSLTRSVRQLVGLSDSHSV